MSYSERMSLMRQPPGTLLFKSVALAIWLSVAISGQLIGAVPTTPATPTAPATAEPPADGNAPDAPPAQGDDSDADAAPSAEAASANTPTGPYAAIMTRNPFGLKPPPPPPTNAPDPAAQVVVSALKLTGITSMPSGVRAMFLVQEPGKPEVRSDLVRAGERDGYIPNLEVLQIDAKAGTVRVSYGGKELALNFADNGVKPPQGPAPTAAPPGGPPGRPGVGGIAPPNVPMNPNVGGNFNADGSSGLRSIPTRPSRLQPNATGGGNYNSGAYNPGAYNPGTFNAGGAYNAGGFNAGTGGAGLPNTVPANVYVPPPPAEPEGPGPQMPPPLPDVPPRAGR